MKTTIQDNIIQYLNEEMKDGSITPDQAEEILDTIKWKIFNDIKLIDTPKDYQIKF